MIRRARLRAMGEAGDTLVEVAMALAILSVTLLTAFHIASQSYAEGMQAREHTQAIQLAQDQAEKLRYWRDYTIQQSLATTPATTPIFTAASIGACNTGPCYVNIGATGVPTLASGTQSIQPFEGIPYRTAIRPYQGPTSLINSSRMQFRVDVQWDAPVESETINGDVNQNDTQIVMVLVDKRGIVPRDCSLVGTVTVGKPCN